jgi:hypothetical protein
MRRNRLLPDDELPVSRDSLHHHPFHPPFFLLRLLLSEFLLFISKIRNIPYLYLQHKTLEKLGSWSSLLLQARAKRNPFTSVFLIFMSAAFLANFSVACFIKSFFIFRHLCSSISFMIRENDSRYDPIFTSKREASLPLITFARA